MVDESIALSVAEDEVHDYRMALEGIYGPVSMSQAKVEGLDGIVIFMIEKSNRWEAHDVITGKVYIWPFEVKCPKCGKKVRANRGRLQEHSWTGSYRCFDCDGSGQYVGETYSHERAAEHGLHPKFTPMAEPIIISTTWDAGNPKQVAGRIDRSKTKAHPVPTSTREEKP